ncbi:MAG: hypothetical protein IJY09_06085 [Lachnospiraceae bacterium]|nr:hypothetical protein [Lachnospiraceae bacterium]
MKEKIEQLSKGKFEYQLPKLQASENELIIRATAGKSFMGSFCISNSKQRRMKGVIYSDSQLFQLEKTQFVGEDNEIPYIFHAEYAKVGEKFSGNLHLVTDAGELSLPYEVRIGVPCLQTSIGEVRDLYQFASLAKANWEEAESFFFSEEFERTLFYHDERFLLLYRMLVATGKKGQAMEEFLVATGKKAPVSVELETKKFSYQAGSYSFMDRIVLKKSGWGYAQFAVTADAPFVQLERSQFCAEDFVNNRLEIGFVIETGEMRGGMHSARIRISSVKKEMEVPVVCYCERKHSEEKKSRQRLRLAEYRLVRNYLEFRSGQKSLKQYLSDAEASLLVYQTEEVSQEQRLLTRFYQIHIWQAAGKDAAARNAMQAVQENGAEALAVYPEAQAAYYYLAAMQKRPELSADEAAEKIKALYQQHPDSWLLLWFLLYLDKDYSDRKRRYEALRQHKGGQNNNPLLLFEALCCLREEPALLKSLERFELLLLQFAIDYRYLNDGIRRQLVFLGAREKSMQPLLYRILTEVYQQNPSKELLTVICTLIIRNGEKLPRYFPWLKLGVIEQLRITELMEFYLYCMEEDASELLHPSVYTYFAYNSEISARKRALLYASLIRAKKENLTVYRTYQPRMEQFAMEQLRAGNISHNLAILYQDIFAEEFPKGECRDMLPVLNFTTELKLSATQPQSVCVAHSEEDVAILPFRAEGTLLTVYSEDAEIFLVDADGCYYPIRNLDRKHGGEYEVSMNRLLSLDRYLWDCFEAGCEDLRLLVHMEEEATRYQKYSGQAFEIYRRLVKLPQLPQKRRNTYVKALLEHYYENFEGEAFEHYLKQISLDLLEAGERSKVINYLLMRGFDEEAMQAMKKYGTDGIDVRRISKLVYRRLYDMERLEPDAFLLELAQYVFECGKYELLVLEYLTKYYYGSTERMFAIWKAAKHEELDTVELEESLLGQMLFAEAYIAQADAVFMSYYQRGMNRKLIRAYLSYHAYKYLLWDRIVSGELFEIMEREVSMEENEVCTLALLKAYSAEDALTEKQMKFVDYKLHGILKKGIFLPFFRRFAKLIRMKERLLERFYVEYRTNPDWNVKIHYRLGSENDFHVEEMKNQCYGIYVKDFLLFEAESLQYYITEEQDGEEVLTESKTVLMDSQLSESSNARMEQLNLILSANRMQEDATVLDLLERYLLLEGEKERLFQGIE